MSNKLASYAINEKDSLGRQYSYQSGIEINDSESIYMKDRRRVLHSDAFNRTRDKTQVFSVTDEKTSALSRMTHSIQVAQLSSDIAEVLSLNKDISYTLGLIHDIGHAPFGHLGQDSLNDLMRDHGGFEHNFQALRIVDKLERNNPSYDGLNLSFEVREGILKHCSLDNAKLLADEGRVFNEKLGTHFPNVAFRHIEGKRSFLESQLVDICDAVSYLHSDLRDAFKNDLLSIEQIKQAPGFNRAYNYYLETEKKEMPTQSEYEISKKNNDKKSEQNINDYICNIINIMYKMAIKDLVSNTRTLINDSNVKTIEDVRNYSSNLIVFSDEQFSLNKKLKVYSRENIYRHPYIHNKRHEQLHAIVGVFNACYKDTTLMAGVNLRDDSSFERNICDHVAGMTDKFLDHSYKYLKENSPDLIVGSFSLSSDFEISPDKATEKKRLKIA